MRVLSLSSRRTLSLLRRVIAPFDVLATRGHAFYFQEVSHFDAAVSYGYDVTLLQNWVLGDDEFEEYARAARERTFVYDLSDPLLLQIPRVQEQLRLARLVSVSNTYLEREVRQFNGRVRVLPSCIDFELFMSGRNVKSDGTPVIGCFGPHDWGMVKEAIEHIREKHPRVRFLGDIYSQHVLGDMVDKIDHNDLGLYPGHVNTCLFGLCPYDGDRGGETIWGLEYGILWKPVVVAKGSQYNTILSDLWYKGKHAPRAYYVSSPQKTEHWVLAMETLLQNSSLRAEIGKCAFDVANAYRAKKQAGEYLACYQKMLPHLN